MAGTERNSVSRVSSGDGSPSSYTFGSYSAGRGSMTIRSTGCERSAWCRAAQSGTSISSSSESRTARSRPSEAEGNRAATCTNANAGVEGGWKTNGVHKRRKSDVVARHAPCRPSSAAANRTGVAFALRPEVPHAPPFPRPAFARPWHARARSVLGHHRTDGHVTAPDRADGPQHGYLQEWVRRQ